MARLGTGRKTTLGAFLRGWRGSIGRGARSIIVPGTAARAFAAMATREAMSWADLAQLAAKLPTPDSVNGPSNAQSRLRLFGQDEDDVRLVFLPFAATRTADTISSRAVRRCA